MKKKTTSNAELDDLAEQVGEFIQYWGFKRIHGKIWAHIYLSAIPLDATTLVKRLKVSKALVSFSIHDLLEYDVIREVARGRGRTVLYEANADVTTVILNVLRLRERKMMSQVMTACKTLEAATRTPGEEIPLDPKKITEMRKMIDSAQNGLDAIIRSSSDAKDLFGAFHV